MSSFPFCLSDPAAQELSDLLEMISLREFPGFLREAAPAIFSPTLPGENPLGFLSVKIKFRESLGDFLEIKMVSFLPTPAAESLDSADSADSADFMAPIIQIVRRDGLTKSESIKSIFGLIETEAKHSEVSVILDLVSRLKNPPELRWDDSAFSRKWYASSPDFWAGLKGYWAGVSAFYDRMHDLLIKELIAQILKENLDRIVLWDLGCGTGKFFKKLLKQLDSKRSGLRGRVIKVVGIDASKENIQKLKKVFIKIRDKKPRLRALAFEGVSKSVDALDILEIKPDETLICVTSGALTRHVMPFLTAEKAFQTLRNKHCQLFIGGGLEPLWINHRIAKNLGFKFQTTEPYDFSGVSLDENFGSRRLTVLTPNATIKAIASRPAEFSEARVASEESGYFERAFSNAFLLRSQGAGVFRDRLASSVSLPEMLDPAS